MVYFEVNSNDPVDTQIASQYFVSGLEDPSATATKAVQGTIYIRVGPEGGTLYQKLDSGETTNWRRISDRMWFSGTTNPSANVGQKNDFYTNTVTGLVFEKVSDTTWEIRGDLTPPAAEPAYKPQKFRVTVTAGVIGDGFFEVPGVASDDSTLVFLNSRILIEGDEYTVTHSVDKTRFNLIGSISPGQPEAMEVGEVLTGIYFVRT